MQKLYLFAVILFLLCGCSHNNLLIGTWQQYDSNNDDRLNVAMGSIQTFTYEPNGDYLQKIEFQIKVKEKSTTIITEINGTWEMVDDTNFRVQTTTSHIIGEDTDEEVENIFDSTYTILTLDEETLETMNEGTTTKYKRIK